MFLTSITTPIPCRCMSIPPPLPLLMVIQAMTTATVPTIGEPGKLDEVSRTVTVEMSDTMRFSPENLEVKHGETLRLVVKNTGKIHHELTLGTIDDLKAHAALMLKHPNMAHKDPNMVQVEPGASGEIVWKFSQAGTIDFACLQPGHYDAGMKGKVAVLH